MTNRIKYYREKRGPTQRALAARAYCGVNSLCGWENGRRIPRVDTALCVARALNVTVDELFGNEQTCK